MRKKVVSLVMVCMLAFSMMTGCVTKIPQRQTIPQAIRKQQIRLQI